MALETDQTADRNVEHLVREIGQVIDGAEPEARAGLRQMASDLMREEVERAGAENERVATVKRPLNPAALGALLLVVGAAIAILLPAIGLMLFGAGVALIGFGLIYRAVGK